MDVLYPRCAGLDVHKKSVVACRIHTVGNGHKNQEIATFGTTTPELLRLLDWLRAGECTHVAMESTGDYWKPVYYLLEGHLELLLVNARHIQAVPGRKTDVKDAEWIADLLRHGLLKASFVPPRAQRDLRDLTRQRTKLVEERARVVNRVQKVLESANIKLSSVATDLQGVSARAMLEALVAGQADPATMAELARGRMREKREALVAALTGCVREHHRFLLTTHLEHMEFLDEQIAQFSQRIAEAIEELSGPPDPPHEPRASGGPGRGGPRAGAAGGLAPAAQLSPGDPAAGPDPGGGGGRGGEDPGGAWDRYAPVSVGCACGELGGADAGKQRECGETAAREDPPGQPDVAESVGAGSTRGDPHEGELLRRALPTTETATWEEASDRGGGACAAGRHLSGAAAAGGVRRAGRRLPGPTPAREDGEAADGAPGTTGLPCDDPNAAHDGGCLTSPWTFTMAQRADFHTRGAEDAAKGARGDRS
jgi:transposase